MATATSSNTKGGDNRKRCFICSLPTPTLQLPSGNRKICELSNPLHLDPPQLLEERRNHSRNRILFKYLLSKCQDEQLKGTLLSSTSTCIVDLCDPCEDVVLGIQKLHLELEVVQMKLIDKLAQLRELILNCRNSQDFAEMEKENVGGARNDTFIRFQRFMRESDGEQIKIPLIFLKKSMPVECQLKLARDPISVDLETHNAVIESESIPKKSMNEGIVIPVECFPSRSMEKEERAAVNEDCASDDYDVGDQDHLGMDQLCSESSTSEEELRDVEPPARSCVDKETSCHAEKRRRKRSSLHKGDTCSEVNIPTNETSSSSNSESEDGREHNQTLPKIKSVSVLKYGQKMKFYCCKLCSYRAADRGLFEHHFRKEHETEDKPFQCPNCPLKFSVEQAYAFHVHFRHAKLNSLIKCELCGSSVKAGQAWKNHLKRKHSDEKLFECDLCGEVYLSFVKFIFHSRRHFGIKLKCDLCPNPEETKHLSVQLELPRHLDEVHGVTDFKLECDAPNCSRIFYFPSYLLAHKRKWHTTNFHCKKCSMTFPSLADLNQHNNRLHPSHKCNICSARFIDSDSVLRHKIHEHKQPKLECELCPPPGRSFGSRSGLKSHKQVHHSGDNVETFLCSKCPKIFSRKNGRDAHEKTHAQTKEFTCEICGLALKSNSNLQKHLRRMHATENETSAKDFCCDKCGYTTMNESYLKRHMMKHNPQFKCDQCHKLFARSIQLKKHKCTDS